jgi:hypothetical protein
VPTEARRLSGSETVLAELPRLRAMLGEDFLDD